MAHRGWGPQIHDDEGNLVFYSLEHPDQVRIGSQDPHPCDYLGSSGTHLCTAGLGKAERGRIETFKIVSSSAYEIVRGDYGIVGPHQTLPDGHEFNMLPGGYSFLVPMYPRREMNLTAYNGPENGMVYDSCFQEIDVRTGDLTFEWCYLDYLPIHETYIFITKKDGNLTSPISGSGNKNHPWDFMHVNAIDKNDENDYVVSARHLDQILKIAGPNSASGLPAGTLIWRLGGKSSNFTYEDGLMFSRQHHVRYVSTEAEETVLSLFDNAWEGANKPSAPYSAGKIISVNNKTMTAHLIKEYPHPRNKTSLARGSMQILPNGNVFIGWGEHPEVTEYDAEGNVLWHAALAHEHTVFAYRSFKMPWVGRPNYPPKLVAYSHSCWLSDDSPLVVYASWNGATEVRSWRFSASYTGAHGPWLQAGTYPKTGFETNATLSSIEKYKTSLYPFPRHARVEALDVNGEVLGSTVAPTFVPPIEVYDNCDMYHCFEPPRFDHSLQAFNAAQFCTFESRTRAWWFELVVVFTLVESVNYVYTVLLGLSVQMYGRLLWK